MTGHVAKVPIKSIVLHVHGSPVTVHVVNVVNLIHVEVPVRTKHSIVAFGPARNVHEHLELDQMKDCPLVNYRSSDIHL